MNEVAFLMLLWVLVSAVLGFAPAQSEQSSGGARMTPEEREKVIRLMTDSQRQFLDLVNGLTEEQWSYKPSPLQWSVGLVAEHIVLTEEALFSAAENALSREPNPDWEKQTQGKAAFIEQVMPNRTIKAQAPIEVRPTGSIARADLMRRYQEQRARALEFARATDRPLKAHTQDHPFPVFNTLNAYDWLLYIPLHNLRHNKQITEVQSSEGYPR